MLTAMRSKRISAWKGPRPRRVWCTSTERWSCKLLPTPGRSTVGAMPTSRRWSASPMPDSMSSCGVLNTPPASSTWGVVDARRSRPLADHPGRERVRLDREVGPAHGRSQKGHGGAAAPAVPDGPLTATKTLLLLAVVVFGERPVGLLRRIEPGIEQGISIAGIDDAQRPAAATPGVLALLPAFAMLGVGKDVGIRPPTAAVLHPPVVVAAVTAHVGHHVDRGAPAEHLPAHRLDPAIVQPGLGFRVVTPVEHPVLPELAEPDRDVDQGIRVAPAGLQEQDADRWIGGEPIREHATRRSRADDHVSA